MRISAVFTTLALALATSAPASACVTYKVDSFYFETPPADVAPNELVLEVQFQSVEAWRLPPFYTSYTANDRGISGRSANYRLSVVRVVRGEFDQDTVLIPVTAICGGVLTRPANGAETGFIVGFVTPPSPGWRETPALVVRYQGRRVSTRPLEFATIVAAKRGDPGAMLKLGRHSRDPVVSKHWYDSASKIIRARAEAGDASAMIQLGLALHNGMAVNDNSPEHQPGAAYVDPAVEWLERAAALGNARAMFLRAEFYIHQSGSIPPLERNTLASNWYLKAAEAGHACAMGRMAQRYRWGWGVPVNSEQSLLWYQKATAAGAIMSPYGYEIEGDAPQGAEYKPPLECPREP